MDGVAERDYEGDADFHSVRDFLISTYAAFGWMYNWGQERWDIQRFGINNEEQLAGERFWEHYVHLWEVGGEVVGVAHPEEGGDLWLEVHPDYRDLENEMVAWGEANRSPARRPDQPFVTYVVASDTHRERVLERRGWTRREVAAHLRKRVMAEPLPECPVADGYVVRSIDLTTERDSEGRAAVSRASFGNKRTGEMMKGLADAPAYRPEHDLAAIAPDGTFAAYAGVWWDEVNRYIIFEPVGTHPDHRRRGLASALMAEGLRIGAALGADTAYVGSGAGKASNILYESLGFTEVTDYERWEAPALSG